MSLRFDGIDDQRQHSLGGCDTTGAWTTADLIKLDAGVSWQAYSGVENSGGSSIIATGRHSSGLIASYTGGGANTQTAVAHSSTDGWMLIMNTRAAGVGSVPRLHKGIVGGAWTHTNGAAGQDNMASQSGGKVVFGQIGGSDFFKGLSAVSAWWAGTALSDAGCESLLTTLTRAFWLSLTPSGLWDELDAFATDHTGNGATRTLLTGTVDDADDPAGWATWAGAVPTPATTVDYRHHPRYLIAGRNTV